jgi:hypothetical protein
MRVYRTKEQCEGGWKRFKLIRIDNDSTLYEVNYQQRMSDPDSNNTYHNLLTKLSVLPDGLLEARALYYQPGFVYRDVMDLDEFLTKLGFEYEQTP